VTDGTNAPRPDWLSDTLEAALEREFQHTRDEARCELTERLNQGLHRLRASESERQWSGTLLDAVRPFASRAAFFAIGDGALRFLGATGAGSDAGDLQVESVPLDAAPVFRRAIETREIVSAPRSSTELSAPIARLVGEAPHEKCYVFPIASSGRMAGVLYAEPAGGPAAIGALELLSNLAGVALAGQSATAQTHDSSNRVTIRQAAQHGGQPGSRLEKRSSNTGHNAINPPSSFASWAALSKQDLAKQEQELHLRAQRFARVRVADMRLYRASAVEAGRARGDLYAALRAEIDAGRQNFREQFLNSCPSMVDYLHVEMVATLANDNSVRLGPEYPGPMI